jgi:Predicted phosphoesterases, related to the Icc protein
MKIACYSDLHLEFKHYWSLPPGLEADVLVLAGDTITFDDFSPLKTFLKSWPIPVLFVAGNHEYYTRAPMFGHHEAFKSWLADELPQVRFIHNESVNIDGVNFFGGTMWTDFRGADMFHMGYAKNYMNDFQLICSGNSNMGSPLTPMETTDLHNEFMAALTRWFETDLRGPRIVISHHAPIENPESEHKGSPLQPAFVANDALPLIEKYQPDFWIYGHTHENFSHTIGKTKVISNQLGYPQRQGGYECGDFDVYGVGVTVPNLIRA